MHGKESARHDRGGVGRKGILLPPDNRLLQLVPLKLQPPVDHAEQVLVDEPVVETRVVDGVDHGTSDDLESEYV